MPTLSLRDLGQRLGQGERFHLQEFACFPNSIKQLSMVASLTVNPGSWTKNFEKEYHSLAEYDTNAVQGFATDGENWYVPITYQMSLTDTNTKGSVVLKLDSSMGKLRGSFGVLAHTGKRHHGGDGDFYQGRLYVPLEEPACVLVLDASLQQIAYVPLSTEGGKHPWCAINPWNGLYYTSVFDHASYAQAYDPQTWSRVPARDIHFIGADVEGALLCRFSYPSRSYAA